MTLSEIDQKLLQACLARKNRSWEDFVDRFLGLVIHVINHTAQCRSVRLSDQDREDLAGEVFLTIISNDFSLLRRFRGESSLATYLTVISRRIIVRELQKRKSPSLGEMAQEAVDQAPDPDASTEQRIDDQEQVQRLMESLGEEEAEIVRLYHLQGLSYNEISRKTGIPENSIGPTLSRAREKMRQST